MTGLLVAAALLRIWMFYAQHRLIYPDEVFQVVEPAHRLVYGNGVVAWEYLVGLRSWIFPGLMTALVWLGQMFGRDPVLEMLPVRLFMVGASLVPVATAYRWGERLRGPWGGLVVGGFVAAWVDLVYIAPHTLSDVIAADVLAAGLYAALPLTSRPGVARLAVAGALFGLALSLRLQLGPALLVASVFACGRRWRDWAPLAGAGAVVVIASGLLDWVTLGSPFQSVWLNVWLNIIKGASRDYGVQSPGYFLLAMLGYWGFASILILLGLVIGGRRFPALLAVAATILITQSAIDHKEWRFFFPALAPVITLCGLAALEQIDDLRRLLGRRSPRPAVLAVSAVAVWALTSAVVASGPGYRSAWTTRRELIDAFDQAARMPGVCGVDLVDIHWWTSPGSAALPPGTPIFVTSRSDVMRFSESYNAVVSDGPADLSTESYRRVACFAGTLDMRGRPESTACLWERGGGCSPGGLGPPPPNWPPYFLDAAGRPRLDRIRAYGHPPN